MMEVQKDLYYFECDECATVLETGKRKLREAVDVLKSERWRFHNNTPDGRFIHYCKACKHT